MNSTVRQAEPPANAADAGSTSEQLGQVKHRLRGHLAIDDAARLVGCSVSTLHRASAELAPVLDVRGKRWYELERLLDAREAGRFARATTVQGEQRAEQIREGFRMLQSGMDPRQLVIELGDFELVEKLYRAWLRLEPKSPKQAPAAPTPSTDQETTGRLRWSEAVNTPGTPEYEAQERELDAFLAARKVQRSGTRPSKPSTNDTTPKEDRPTVS